MKSIDTTGAGDAFVGGILSILASNKDLYNVTSDIHLTFIGLRLLYQ